MLSRDRPQLVLHIGRPKTGTTAIQRFLSESGSWLRSQGWYYPTAGRGTSYGHHELARSIAFSDRAAQTGLFPRLLSNSQLTSNIIISSEMFSNIRFTSQLTDFRKAFSSHTWTVLLYVREPVKFLAASYAQRVQATNYSGPFTEYAFSHQLRLPEMIEVWTSVADDLRIRFYDRQHLKSGDAVLDFCEVVGLANPEVNPGPDPNISIGGNLLYAKRLTNHFFPDLGNQRLYSVFRDIALQDASVRPGFRLDQTTVRELWDFNGAEVELLLQLFPEMLEKPNLLDAPLSPDWHNLRGDLQRWASAMRTPEFDFIAGNVIRLD